ncbi:MAG: hypothetical protein LDL39_10015 [Magnetospirillum sp.]|nr:hypothetical protein [Magnetospirillum sp.]
MNDPAKHYVNSSARERLIEHLFLAEILRELWKRGIHDPEVLRSEVDNAGYDLVIGVGTIVRHIQLKSSVSTAKTAKQSVNIRLMEKPSGCVVWAELDENTIQIGPFRWFGCLPGNPLPSILDYPITKHTKGNKDGVKTERPNLRDIAKGKFEVVKTMSQLVGKLFG